MDGPSFITDERSGFVGGVQPRVRMRRRRGAVCEAASAAPQAISFPSCGKRYGRKGRWGREIALTRLKNLSFHFACYRYTVRSPNALRATVQSGFPIARRAARVVLFAPVEYLTYGSQNSSIFYWLSCGKTTSGLEHIITMFKPDADVNSNSP